MAVHLCFVGMPAPGSSGLEAIPNADFWRAFFGNVAHGGSVVYVLGALLALAMLDLLMGPSNWGVVYRVSGVCVWGGGYAAWGAVCVRYVGSVSGWVCFRGWRQTTTQRGCTTKLLPRLGRLQGPRRVNLFDLFFPGEPEPSPPYAVWW